ncbi:hypothetical protein ACCAA_130078 [Candidatus Accumulibacter aalborgensis]|uniref:Uncharacterized protein n=1 Tax=Candidatus Accumulibacter aalborgensis TaxID=1860102 RepID=A0A1A8XHE0_9PROT|nr:hypothetical protein ACCAA_130078 [Candidatus Accumulibacter aalborgensis]
MRLALTDTPAENRLGDRWSLLCLGAQIHLPWYGRSLAEEGEAVGRQGRHAWEFWTGSSPAVTRRPVRRSTPQ